VAKETEHTAESRAIRLTGTVVGEVWVVEAGALKQYPEILESGLPIFHVKELERLVGRDPEMLKAIAVVKSVFPTAVLRAGSVEGIVCKLVNDKVEWEMPYGQMEGKAGR